MRVEVREMQNFHLCRLLRQESAPLLQRQVFYRFFRRMTISTHENISIIF